MTELCQINALAQKWHLAYFVPIDGHFDQWLEIRTSNLFCPALTFTLIYKPILKTIRLKLAFLSPKILNKFTKMAISQNPILPKCHLRFFWILGSNYFRGLNQKSIQLVCAKLICTLILKVSEKFIEKCRRSRHFGD